MTHARQKSTMTAGQICIRGVRTAARDESVCMIARRMKDHNVSSLIIVDDTKKPIGIVTERDLTVRVLAADKDPCTTTAGDVMSKEMKPLSIETPLEHALELMRSGPYRRLPVIDRMGELIGLLSIDNILEELAVEFYRVD